MMLIISLLTLLFVFRKQSNMVDEVHHTWEVKSLLYEIQNSIKNAETGQRGYLLTKETAYLEPFHQGKLDYESFRNDVQEVIKNSPDQLAKLSKLDSLATLKMEELEASIQLAEQGKDSLVLELLKSDAGKLYMDDIRTLLRDMLDEETRLLEIREENFRLWRYGSYTLLFLCALLSVYLVVRLYNYVMPFFEELVNARKALHNSNANMSETIAVLKAEFNEKENELRQKEQQLKNLSEEIETLNRDLKKRKK
ncbi:CHASE3 domain-containing protein [Flavilitoribacter nigricans]|nr:CHASE3 domain-containing protein [Flavilitoribacter nigricans]